MSAEPLNFTLEVIVVPVSDVDRSMAFYVDKAGFEVDHDTRVSDAMRIVQFTPARIGLHERAPTDERTREVARWSLRPPVD